MHKYLCQCRDCRRARRKGLVLGSRLLRYLGDGAYSVSQYVRYHRFKRGRRPDVCQDDE